VVVVVVVVAGHQFKRGDAYRFGLKIPTVHSLSSEEVCVLCVTVFYVGSLVCHDHRLKRPVSGLGRQ
jgi:hypothetical protein